MICRSVGRDFSVIGKTGWACIRFMGNTPAENIPPHMILGTPEEIAARLHEIHQSGVDHISCYIDDGEGPITTNPFPTLTARGLAQFAQVIAAARRLEVSAAG